MHTLTKKQYEEYKKYEYDKNHGRLLTGDFIRFVCEANNYDPESIGQYFLELLVKLRSEGAVS